MHYYAMYRIIVGQEVGRFCVDVWSMVKSKKRLHLKKKRRGGDEEEEEEEEGGGGGEKRDMLVR